MSVHLNPQQQDVIDTVSRYGWMVMTVGPTEEYPETPWFAYTAGLSVTFGWPELICFELPPDVAHAALNNAVGELRQNAIRPAAGVELIEVLQNGKVRLQTFSHSHYQSRLAWAIWYAKRNQAELSCLQLLWPDKSGRLPGDPACDPVVAAVQLRRGRRWSQR